MKQVLKLALFLALYLPLVLLATTYYVSPTGDNALTGTSPAEAWQTLAYASSQTFLPGDTLALEGGALHAGTLSLEATDAGGGSANPLLITSYGTGRATISAGLGYGIEVLNTAGIVIQNLNVSGDGLLVNTGSGIRFRNTLMGDMKLPYIFIENVEIQGFGEAGIEINGEQVNSGFSDITLTSLQVHDCRDRGISMLGDYDQFKTGYAHEQVRVTYCEVYQIPGYNKGEHSGNGIVLSDLHDGIIEYCVAHDCGSGNTNCGGPVGIWFWDSDSVVIQHCEAYQISSGTGCDGGGFDLDGGVTRGIMQYNYSHDNEGPGYLVGQFGDARPMDDITVRYNISENDAQTNRGSITLFRGSTTPISNIRLYQNTVYLSPSAGYPAATLFLLVVWRRVTGIQVFNNVFYSDNGAGIMEIPAGYSAIFQGNSYYASGAFSIDYHGATYGSLASFRSGTNQETLGGSAVGTEGDPGLSMPGGGGTIGFGNSLTNLAAYRLTTGAGALSGGIDLQAEYALDLGSQDFYGNSPSASGEIGADQAGTPFPLFLMDWRGEADPNGVNLIWESGSYEGGYFAVEQKDPEKGWTTLGLVPEHEKLSPSYPYSYYHVFERPGEHAFRLRHIDQEGVETLSSVQVFQASPNPSAFLLSPNPVQDELTIRGEF